MYNRVANNRGQTTVSMLAYDIWGHPLADFKQ